MADGFMKVYKGLDLNPISADPNNPTDGDLQFSDGTHRPEGLWTYHGGEWQKAGGGIDKWEATTDYRTNDVVWLDDDKKVYVALSNFTSGATFNSLNWSELSQAPGGLSEFLNDPSFEAGVAEWSCTNATIAVDTAKKVGNGKQSAKITGTADGGFCDLVVDFSTIDDTLDSTVEVGAYLATADASAGFQIRKDNAVFAERDLIIDNKFTYFSSFPRAQGITGMRVLVDLNDVVNVDEATISLGKAKVAASKECSGDLDCENNFSAKVSDAGVVSGENLDWIKTVNITDTSLFEVVFNSVFKQPPNCQVVTVDSQTLNDRIAKISTQATTDSVFVRTSASSSATDFSEQAFPFNIYCGKGTDYKTTQQQGVVLTGGNSAGALVRAAIPGGQTISTSSTILAIAEADIKRTEHFTFDDSTDSFTTLKGGRIGVNLSLNISNATTSSTTEARIEVDSGSGFVSRGICGSGRTAINTATRLIIKCEDAFDVQAGNRFRIALIGIESGVTETTTNTTQVLTVVPVLTRAEIAADLKGYSKVEGESGRFAEGWASFGGATDESVCDSSPCTRYRAVGDVGRNMSVTRSSTGTYEATVTGFKSDSNIKCDSNASDGNSSTRSAELAVNSLQSDSNGDAVFQVRTGLSEMISGTAELKNTYFQISCKGEVP